MNMTGDRTTNPIKVFISHSQRDKQWVREFAEILETSGINVWLDDFEIAVGEPIADKLTEALRSSDSLVFVFGTQSTQTPWLFFELGMALSLGKRVIAVVGRDVAVKELPEPIRERRYLVMESPQETAREVAEALTKTG